MRRELRFAKHLLFLLIIVGVILSTPFSAMAADDKDDDYTTARLYLSTYALYDLSDEVWDADTVADMFTAHAKVDRWARYYDVEQFAAYNEGYSGSKVGIGIYYAIRDGKVEVMSVIEDSPAYLANIQAGDIITKINGQELDGMTEDEISEEFSGEEGSMVIITVERNGVAKSYAMTRAIIEVKTVTYEMLDDTTGYIYISHFVMNTSSQFKRALTDLKDQGATALVLDLRNCPGGMLTSVVSISGAFIPDGPAVFVQYKNGRESFTLTNNWDMGKMPVAVLVNGETASGGELLAANIQDANAGVVIGTQTYGKGVVQSIFSLPSGAGIVFTTSKYFSCGRQDIDANHGVTPDILVTDADEQMAEAMDYLALQKRAGQMIAFSMGSKTIMIDDVASTLNQAPFALEGRSYFPAREALEAIGYEVSYYQGMIYLFKDGQRAVLNLSEGTYMEGGIYTSYNLQVKKNTLFLPASFFSQALDCTVTWNGSTHQVEIMVP